MRSCRVHRAQELNVTGFLSSMQVYFTPTGTGAAAEFAIDNVCVQQYLLAALG